MNCERASYEWDRDQEKKMQTVGKFHAESMTFFNNIKIWWVFFIFFCFVKKFLLLENIVVIIIIIIIIIIILWFITYWGCLIMGLSFDLWWTFQTETHLQFERTTIGGLVQNDVTKKRDEIYVLEMNWKKSRNPIHHKRISLRHISLISSNKMLKNQVSEWVRKRDRSKYY